MSYTIKDKHNHIYEPNINSLELAKEKAHKYAVERLHYRLTCFDPANIDGGTDSVSMRIWHYNQCVGEVVVSTKYKQWGRNREYLKWPRRSVSHRMRCDRLHVWILTCGHGVVDYNIGYTRWRNGITTMSHAHRTKYCQACYEEEQRGVENDPCVNKVVIPNDVHVHQPGQRMATRKDPNSFVKSVEDAVREVETWPQWMRQALQSEPTPVTREDHRKIGEYDDGNL